MKSKDTYIENKVKNTFTAYLIKAVHGARRGYLAKKNKILIHEDYLEDMPNTPSYRFEGHIDFHNRQPGDLGDLENHKLFRAVMCLKDSEREIIYYHIFEEKTFADIAMKLQLSESLVKGRYYYALTKIRNRMRGEEI